MTEDMEFIKDGKRMDGREVDEVREMEAKAGILENADGSGYFRMGKTEAVAAVQGPRELHPQHMQKAKRAILRCRYSLTPFSTEDRVRPGPSRRSREINKVVRDALSSVIFLEEFPSATIDLFTDVITADAGTRCVALNAGAIALADAGIPMKGLVSACAAGKVDDTVVLDVMSEEDKYGQVDLPVAISHNNDQITLMQMDGIASEKEMDEMIKLAKKGCKMVYEKQKEALNEEFEGEING
ncbi:MAG: exosome complex exonuclease Rrp41 [Candidatus Aenigmatarchaeota archaeon]